MARVIQFDWRRLFALGVALVPVWALAGDLSISYAPVWPDFVPITGYIPLTVEVSNKAADTNGIVRLTGQGQTTNVPVELPRGSDKVVTLYLQSGDSFEDNTLELITSAGSVSTRVEVPGSAGKKSVIGVISDHQGLLAGLRTSKVLFDTSCTPEQAPTRSVGYQGLAALVLYEGSERLSDQALLAIERYVLTGGRVLFVGGASAPWDRDPRWKLISPVAVTSAQPLTGPAELGGDPRLVLPETTVLAAQPMGAATVVARSGKYPLIVKRPFGLGQAEFWAFDPFAEPVRSWEGRSTLFSRLIAGRPPESAEEPPRWVAGTPYESAGSDPFQARVPPAGQIALILFGFFVLVIPVNFAVLAKRRSGELAWITVPFISAAFSAVIFASASNLNSARPSRLLEGALVVQDGSDLGMYQGAEQLFFARAGTYDLGLHGVEAAANQDTSGRAFGGPGNLLDDRPSFVDLGEVTAPSVSVPNLAFRKLDITQPVTFKGRFVIMAKTKKEGGTTKLFGTVTNTSPYRLTNPGVWLDGSLYGLPNLEPGETVEITPVPVTGSRKGLQEPPFTGPRPALQGRIEGIPIGAQLGEEPPGRKGCRLVYVWDSLMGSAP